MRARIRDALARREADGIATSGGAGEAAAGVACTVRIVCRAGSPPEVEVEPPRDPATRPLRVRGHRGLREHPHIKHLGFGPQLYARHAARAAGFDDALLVDAADRVAEGTFWNLAVLEGRTIVWPEAPVLEGVTQRRLQVALEAAGVPQRRRVVHLGEFAGMRAAYALNSRGLQEIGTVDGHRLPGDPAMTERLRALLAADPWQRP